MAGRGFILLLFFSSAWMYTIDGVRSTGSSSRRTSQRCSDAVVYLTQDWDLYVSCCDQLYPNETCPIACPCRNGAECFQDNRTCACKPGWVGIRCQRSCREKNNSTYGQACKRRCRCGPDATCDPVTGLCECVDPHNCTARCPVNRYGPNCRWKCRCKAGSCDHMTGSCDNTDESHQNCNCLNGGSCRTNSPTCRCQPGWIGDRCGVPCSSGFYGEECALSCGCGDNSTCNAMTGLCSCAGGNKYSCSGRCPPGVYGPRCSYQCNCPSRLTCNQLTGDCQCTDQNECREILFGPSTEEPNKNTQETSTTETTPTTAATATGAIASTFTASRPTSTRHTARKTTTSPDAPKEGDLAVDGSVAGAAEGSPQRNDESLGGGIGFYPSAPFWGVVSAIAILLLIVVVLLILILRRQMSSKSPLTRRTKIGRQENVYETVEELSKGTTEPEAKLAPPPLPDMFQRGGPARSSLRSFHHRPISVHSPMASMDAPLPASVAALVCNYGSPPPVPGGTSRRSLMAEWRPYNRPERLMQENRAKSRSHSSLTDLSLTDPVNGYNAIFVEDDYADPFDTILPSLDVSNRSSGYFATVGEGNSQRTSQNGSPVTLRHGGSSSPMIAKRCNSPVTVQRRDSPVTTERSCSPMDFQDRSGSPMTVKHRHSDYNMNSFRSISPATVKERPYSAAVSTQRSESPVTDPFYFTLEQQSSPAGSPAGIVGPEDDYDEVDPQSPISSPSGAVLAAANTGTLSERSSTSSRGSSRTSLGANSPTLSSSYGTSPCDTEMYDVLDDKTEKTRPRLPQRPLSSNVYESCGPRPPPLPVDDHGIYSKLNRNPSQRGDHRGSLQRRQDESPYGRLERSYSARNAVRTPGSDDLQGRVPQRSRSAMVKGNQGTRSTECIAGEWVPAESGHRALPHLRGTKSPLVTEPRKKFRFSLKGKKQLTKKSSTEELDSAEITS